jgi:hypothetical protein
VAVTNFVAPSLMFTPPPNVEVRNAQKSFTMSVRNVSDRLVRSVQLYVQVRSSLGIIGGGPAITRALAPGEWAYVRSDGAIAQAMVNDPGVRVLVGVESVTFEECEYRPSQPAQTFPRVR